MGWPTARPAAITKAFLHPAGTASPMRGPRDRSLRTTNKCSIIFPRKQEPEGWSIESSVMRVSIVQGHSNSLEEEGRSMHMREVGTDVGFDKAQCSVDGGPPGTLSPWGAGSLNSFGQRASPTEGASLTSSHVCALRPYSPYNPSTGSTMINCLDQNAISLTTRHCHIVTDWLLLPVPLIIIWRLQMHFSRKI